MTKAKRPDQSSIVLDEDIEKLRLLLSLLNESGQPNTNPLMVALRDLRVSNLNIKTAGYDLARRLAAALPQANTGVASHVGLMCKPSTQADLESEWAAYWCNQLKIPVLFHRKIWELAYVLQAIYENGHMASGAKGLGFGCGVEPLPSYLASQGVAVTMTDLPESKAQAAGWVATNQHTATLAQAHHANLVSKEVFDHLVRLREVDMTAIPSDLQDYDFCWSICALEHLGSLDRGLAFIENSLCTLRPGGLSVHTTEINMDSVGNTIDNWPTVLFQRGHFEDLAERLRGLGHDVAILNFDYGDRPMDRFIDLPPYHHDLPTDLGDFLGSSMHLKLAIDGFPCTCFGVIVRKRVD